MIDSLVVKNLTTLRYVVRVISDFKLVAQTSTISHLSPNRGSNTSREKNPVSAASYLQSQDVFILKQLISLNVK